MSFADISSRMREAGWPKGGSVSENSLKKHVRLILTRADEAVRVERSSLDRALSLRMGYPVNPLLLGRRLQQHLHRMLSKTPLLRWAQGMPHLASLLSNRLTEIIIDTIQSGEMIDQAVDYPLYAVNNFMKYICGGVSYPRFLGAEGLILSKKFDSIEMMCLFFMKLRELNGKPIKYRESLKHRILLLSSLARSYSLPSELFPLFDQCSESISSDNSDWNKVGSSANDAALILEDEMYLEWFRVNGSIVNLEEISHSIDHLLIFIRESSISIDPNLSDGLRDFARRISYVNSFKETSPPRDNFHKSFQSLREDARALFSQLIQITTSVSLKSIQSKIDEIMRNLRVLIASLPKGPEETNNSAAQKSRLEEFLEVIEENSSIGYFRIRPYELFLFAKQNGLMTSIFTIPRKQLTPGYPRLAEYRSDLSIIFTHKGGEPPMDIGDLF